MSRLLTLTLDVDGEIVTSISMREDHICPDVLYRFAVNAPAHMTGEPLTEWCAREALRVEALTLDAKDSA